MTSRISEESFKKNAAFFNNMIFSHTKKYFFAHKKGQNVTKLKKTQHFTKLKNSKYDKTQKLPL